MGTLSVAVLLSAFTGQAGETVLLDFYGTHCGPCRAMEPTVARLQSAGYPVKKVNVADNIEMAQQFRVSSVPCFVLVAGGREVGRVNGAVSYDVLAQLFRRAGYRPGDAQATPTTANVAQRGRGRLPNGYGYGNDRVTASVTSATMASQQRPVRQASFNSSPPTPRNEAQNRAFAASVRIQVADATGKSFGTGTIIDMHGNDALVLTCGHIFRQSQGRGPINVDVFANGQTRTVQGELISYNADKNDIGLISIQPGVQLTPARVATSAARPAIGNAVFTVGCDNGADPTIQVSRITALNKYLGPANIEVAGKPVNGRSGGGLFNADGALIGVCNAADDLDNEGIYRGLRTIHEHLAAIGQQRLYQTDMNLLASRGSSRSNGASTPRSGLNQLASQVNNAVADVQQAVNTTGWKTQANDAVRQVSASAEDALRGAMTSVGSESKVIFVVPNSRDSSGQPSVVVVDQPSKQLVEQIQQESQRRANDSFAGNTGRRWRRPPDSTIMRAQSRR